MTLYGTADTSVSLALDQADMVIEAIERSAPNLKGWSDYELETAQRLLSDPDLNPEDLNDTEMDIMGKINESYRCINGIELVNSIKSDIKKFGYFTGSAEYSIRLVEGLSRELWEAAQHRARKGDLT